MRQDIAMKSQKENVRDVRRRHGVEAREQSKYVVEAERYAETRIYMNAVRQGHRTIRQMGTEMAFVVRMRQTMPIL